MFLLIKSGSDLSFPLRGQGYPGSYKVGPHFPLYKVVVSGGISVGTLFPCTRWWLVYLPLYKGVVALSLYTHVLKVLLYTGGVGSLCIHDGTLSLSCIRGVSLALLLYTGRVAFSLYT